MTAPYGPPPGYGPPPARPPRRANVAAMVVAAVGGAVAIVGGIVDWYDGSITVADIVHALDSGADHSFAKAWFGAAMWVALALTVIGALFANAAGPMSTPLRIVTPLLALVTTGATVGALSDLLPDGASFTDHSQAGLWMTLLGPLVAGAAAIVGPRAVRAPFAPPPYAPTY